MIRLYSLVEASYFIVVDSAKFQMDESADKFCCWAKIQHFSGVAIVKYGHPSHENITLQFVISRISPAGPIVYLCLGLLFLCISVL